MEKVENNISQVIAPMYAITMELDVIIGRLLRDKFAMSMADFKILRAIHMLNTCTQLDVSRFNHVTEAAVSKRIRALTDKSLITKTANPEDKRKLILSLTVKGKSLMGQLQVAVIGNIELILADFPESKRKLTSESLTAILKMIVTHSPNRDILMESKHPVLTRLKECKINRN
jgi:DNA-binding MarR family transcriptional regulator